VLDTLAELRGSRVRRSAARAGARLEVADGGAAAVALEELAHHQARVGAERVGARGVEREAVRGNVARNVAHAGQQPARAERGDEGGREVERAAVGHRCALRRELRRVRLVRGEGRGVSD